MLTSPEVSIIGNVLNTTWGRHSTEPGAFPLGTAPTHSVTGQLIGETQPEEGADCRLVVKYVTIVTFRDEREAEMERRRFKREAEDVVNACVKGLKEQFKGAAGRALKLKQLQADDSIQTMYLGGPHLSVYTQRHTLQLHRAYYRYNVTFNVA